MKRSEKITDILRRRGLSNREAARRVGGVSPTKVGNWRTGKHEPSASELERLARVCEVPVTYFFDDASDEETLRRHADAEALIGAFEGSGLTIREAVKVLFGASTRAGRRKHPSK